MDLMQSKKNFLKLLHYFFPFSEFFPLKYSSTTIFPFLILSDSMIFLLNFDKGSISFFIHSPNILDGLDREPNFIQQTFSYKIYFGNTFTLFSQRECRTKGFFENSYIFSLRHNILISHDQYSGFFFILFIQLQFKIVFR